MYTFLCTIHVHIRNYGHTYVTMVKCIRYKLEYVHSGHWGISRNRYTLYIQTYIMYILAMITLYTEGKLHYVKKIFVSGKIFKCLPKTFHTLVMHVQLVHYYLAYRQKRCTKSAQGILLYIRIHPIHQNLFQWTSRKYVCMFTWVPCLWLWWRVCGRWD